MQVALRELLYGACALLANCSAQVAFLQPELRDCTLRTSYCGNVLRVLLLYENL